MLQKIADDGVVVSASSPAGRLGQAGHAGRAGGQRTASAVATIAPDMALVVPPESVAQMQHVAAMRTPPMFAPSAGALKPDHLREFGRVDRV